MEINLILLANHVVGDRVAFQFANLFDCKVLLKLHHLLHLIVETSDGLTRYSRKLERVLQNHHSLVWEGEWPRFLH